MTPAAPTRAREGARAGLLGIGVNLALAAVKALIGFQSGAISILADAANSLTDAASSIATFLGFRVAAKPADDEHPYGHARSEYVAGFFVALSMLVVAVELFRSSLLRVLSPARVHLSPVAFFLLLLAVAGKLFLFFYYRRSAARLSSATLRATATDCLADVFSSGAVLVCAVLGEFTPLMPDGYAGCLVSVFLFVGGLRAASETVSSLLGTAPPAELVEQIETRILSFDSVLGIHDLVIHSYGEGRRFATVHVEFDSTQDFLTSHEIADRIERELLEQDRIQLVVHLDPIVTDDELQHAVREQVEDYLRTLGENLSTHDFRAVYGPTQTNFIFDVSVPMSFAIPDAKLVSLLKDFVSGLDRHYFAVVTVDRFAVPLGRGTRRGAR